MTTQPERDPTTWPACLVSAASADRHGAEMVDYQVRAMTWNVWWRFGPRWRERRPGILATIQRFTPDVVGLQEVWSTGERTQADELAEALGFSATFAAPSYPAAPDPPVAPDHTGVELGVALLSRWPIVRRDVIMMPARTPAPGTRSSPRPLAQGAGP